MKIAVWRGILLGVLLATAFPAGAVAGEVTPTWPQGRSPSPRAYHTAVWTGTEMIVWGGSDRSGARYDPSTDRWTLLPLDGRPLNVFRHTAVWTGSEMIVWGGDVAGGHLATGGGRYNPSTNKWMPLSEEGPVPRAQHFAFWTGKEMIIWGGYHRGDDLLHSGNGARYDPTTDSWEPVTRAGEPNFRHISYGVWAGREMIVWGSRGGSYDPSSDRWRQIRSVASIIAYPSASTGVPRWVGRGSTVWTGREIILWGGLGYHGRSGGTPHKRRIAIRSSSMEMERH